MKKKYQIKILLAMLKTELEAIKQDQIKSRYLRTQMQIYVRAKIEALEWVLNEM